MYAWVWVCVDAVDEAVIVLPDAAAAAGIGEVPVLASVQNVAGMSLEHLHARAMMALRGTAHSFVKSVHN